MTTDKYRFQIGIPFLLILTSLTGAGTYDANLTVTQNWNGWDSTYVFTNNIISVAVIPSIGAHIMQYNLDTNRTLWIDTTELGQINPLQDDQYANYGGFKNWPAPQANWGSIWTNWPPPQSLDYGTYTPQVISNTSDSIVFFVQSPVETFTDSAKGLQFKRIMTFYRNSTRLRVDQRLFNVSSPRKQWGVWDDTQLRGCHEPDSDYGNFWVYYPHRSNLPSDSPTYSIQYLGGVDSATASFQLKPNIAPGIDGFQYNKKRFKIGINTDQGWIAYVDQLTATTYVKKTPYVPGAIYPDSQSVFEVFATESTDPTTEVEVEALSPLKNMMPGDSNCFVEDWYAARTFGPILAISNAGAVHEHLSVSPYGAVSGKFGVFYTGQVNLQIATQSPAIKSYNVSPLDSFVINEPPILPAGTYLASLLLYDNSGKFVDTLDKIATSVPVINGIQHGTVPNVRINSNAINIKIPSSEIASIRLISLDGKCVYYKQLSGVHEMHVSLTGYKPGVYLYAITAGAEKFEGKFTKE